MANVKSERRTNLKILIYPMGFIGSCRTKKSGILRLRRIPDFLFLKTEKGISLRYGTVCWECRECDVRSVRDHSR